jgi:hypothetical protein
MASCYKMRAGILPNLTIMLFFFVRDVLLLLFVLGSLVGDAFLYAVNVIARIKAARRGKVAREARQSVIRVP